jgi:hypothetical protein
VPAPSSLAEEAPTIGAERRGVFEKAVEPFGFGGESGTISPPTPGEIKKLGSKLLHGAKK